MSTFNLTIPKKKAEVKEKPSVPKFGPPAADAAGWVQPSLPAPSSPISGSTGSISGTSGLTFSKVSVICKSQEILDIPIVDLKMATPLDVSKKLLARAGVSPEYDSSLKLIDQENKTRKANRNGSTNIWLVGQNGFGTDINLSYYDGHCPCCGHDDEIHLDDMGIMGSNYECLNCEAKFFVTAEDEYVICTR